MNKKTTILYAHPYDKSFNHAIFDEVRKKLESEGRDYNVIDLYADHFNPVLDADSLRLYSRGGSADPLVEKYVSTLLETDCFIMIFPVWWAMMPAIVKGFFDKVMLSGTAYQYSPEGELVPDKINVGRTVIFTTSQGPTERFAPFFSDYFKPLVLDAVGFANAEWHNCDRTSHGPAENRDNFLALVREIV